MIIKSLELFQSPSGDSLFSDEIPQNIWRLQNLCFNPLAGIRCFLTANEQPR